MKTIDFCIPFISLGLRYTEFLISNLLATATHPERISIILSVHTPSDAELIKISSFSDKVKRIIMARAYSSQELPRDAVMGSANHCSAMQALCEQTSADVVIFSDYDMAFLVAGWDEKIIEILDNHHLCGVGYPNVTYTVTLKNFTEMKLFARKYQNMPNLSFLAITRQNIETYFPQGLSHFHDYLSAGGLHLQFINTQQMANALQLPLGTFWAMDSGCEIPFVIQRHALRYQTFIPVAFDKQPVFSPNVFTASPSSLLLPDVFIDGETGAPFLAHYTAGSHKSAENPANNNATFDNFMAAVNSYLAK